MSFLHRVVARHRDGRVVRGATRDFVPNRPSFHVEPPDGGPAVRVVLDELKALFFVKDLDGDPSRVDVPRFVGEPADGARGRKVAVRFPDGEIVCGYAVAERDECRGFFLSSLDPLGNNERIYVVATSGVEIVSGSDAEALVRRVSGEAA